MSYSLNHVQLIGNLGKDPELRFTSTGVPVCSFSIATSESWKDEAGEKHERTEWHNITAWRKLAEICGEWLKKGKKVYVSGKLQTTSWDDKNTGTKKYKTEIVINDMIMLDGKKQDGAPEPQEHPQAAEPKGGTPGEAYSQAQANDDLPF